MKKQFSLKRLLSKTIIFYWIFPVLLIIAFLTYYSNLKLKTNFLDEISITVSSTMEIAQQHLLYVVQESKKATYEETIKDAYSLYQDDNDQLALYKTTTSYLKNSYQYNTYIEESILIYHDIENQFYMGNSNNSSWRFEQTKSFIEQNKDYFINTSSQIGTYLKFVILDGELFLVRNLVNSDYSPYAVLIFKLNISEIFDSIINMPFSDQVLLFVDNQILHLSTSNEVINLVITPTSNDLQRLPNGNYVYQTDFNIDSSNMEYQVILSTDILKQDYKILIAIIISVVLFVATLVSFVVYILYKHFSIPIQILLHATNKIENGKIGYQIKKIPQSIEFSYLFEHFNNMSLSMQEQVDVIYKEQEALQNAKIKALQSQINPHFLNNTLEVINWEMRMGETQKSIEMIESLSTMLNASIARNEKPLKSLQEELIYVNAYLHIVSTRMGKRLKIKKEIDPNVTHYKVPLLILQPIVENAIEHGIKTSGTITIRAYQLKESLIIEVENDTPLTSKNKKRIDALLNWDGNESNEHIAHSSLGIRNVNQRIKLIFGDKYGLSIISSEHNSTISTITIPTR